MKKIAVLLSGCGVFDGAEIHESVLTLLEVSRAGAEYQCFAPDIAQMHVVNHLSGEVQSQDTRSVLQEAARLARGEIMSTERLNITEFDGLIIPGGFGAAKNLCNFAVKGTDCEVEPSVSLFITQFVEADKPVGFICISPIMIPLLYGKGAIGTIGTDTETAQAFDLLGGKHQAVSVHDIVVDEANKLVSTPAYMLAQNILEAHSGIAKLVAKIVEMA